MSLEPREFPDIPYKWKQIDKQGKARDAQPGKKKSNPNSHRLKRDPIEGTTTKFEALTLHADTDPDISQKRGKGANGADQGKKKKKAVKQEPPPPPKPRFEELLPGLSADELSSYIDTQSKRFEDPLVWLRDVVSFLQTRLDADPKQYGPLMDPKDNLFPFSALSNDIKQILLRALEPQSDRVLENLFVDCIREVLIPQLHPNKPTYGVRVVLKAICVHRYQVVAHCKRLPELACSYATVPKLSLSILWAIFDIESLLPAFTTWHNAMFPILLGHAAKDVNRCVWNSLSNILAYHKSIHTELGRQLLKPGDHSEILSAFAKHHDNNASDEIKQEFHRVCGLLQHFAYQYEPQNTLRAHFSHLLGLLNAGTSGSRFLQEQYLGCLVACVESDSHCSRVWWGSVLGQLPATLLLLRCLYDRKDKTLDNINRINIKREGARKLVSSSQNLFSGLKEELKNQENVLFAKSHKSEEYKQVMELVLKLEKESAARRILVNNLKAPPKKGSWLKSIFWFSFLFFISALIVDVASHETLRVTFFGRFLDDIGVLPWVMLVKNSLVERYPQLVEVSETSWAWVKQRSVIAVEYSKFFLDEIFPRYMRALLNFLVLVCEEILVFTHPVWVYMIEKFDRFANWFYTEVFHSHFVQHSLNGLLNDLGEYFHTSPI